MSAQVGTWVDGRRVFISANFDGGFTVEDHNGDKVLLTRKQLEWLLDRTREIQPKPVLDSGRGK